MLSIFFSIAGTAFLGCFGWIFQRALTLGTRVSVIETRQEDLPILITSKFDEVNRRLSRIETAMNGALPH